MKQVKRGEIYYADLSPVVGSEQDGTRPVLVIQNDTGNKFSPTTIVAAITSKSDKAKLPTHVIVHAEGLATESVILLEQIQTIDKRRMIRYSGRLDKAAMGKVEHTIIVSFGIKYMEGWSDEDYRVVDVRNNAYTKLTVSLERIPEQMGALSPEHLLIEQYDQLDREQFCRLLLEGINTCLSETQRRRLLKFYFKGLTQTEIADAENVAQQNIAESLWRSIEKLKKFFKKAML